MNECLHKFAAKKTDTTSFKDKMSNAGMGKSKTLPNNSKPIDLASIEAKKSNLWDRAKNKVQGQVRGTNGKLKTRAKVAAGALGVAGLGGGAYALSGKDEK